MLLTQGGASSSSTEFFKAKDLAIATQHRLSDGGWFRKEIRPSTISRPEVVSRIAGQVLTKPLVPSRSLAATFYRRWRRDDRRCRVGRSI